MKSFKHNIKDELGLHARPASVLATEAKKYSSKITVTANDKTVDGAKYDRSYDNGIKAWTGNNY